MTLVSKSSSIKLSHTIRILESPLHTSLKSCIGCNSAHAFGYQIKRSFVATPSVGLAEREYFSAPKDTEKIRFTPPAWHHPVYTEQQMNAINVAHRDTKQWSDRVALMMVRLLRFGMDTATGYSHPNKEARKQAWPLGLTRVRSWFGPSPMTERKWLMRFLFLESVAGVPGMVAASVRHLHSLRRLKRDNGWQAISNIMSRMKLIVPVG